MPTAVITGANRGLGLELARQYLDSGWTLYVIVRRSSDALQDLQSKYPLHIIMANLTDDDSLRSAVAAIDTDSIDLLINSAGTMGDGSFAKTGMEYQKFGTFKRSEWQRVFDINVFTPMALTELLINKLEAASAGCVVTFSSIAGSNAFNTIGNLYPYRASKAAVNSIMKSMGSNLAKRGVIAVAIHPGWIKTDMGGPAAELEATGAMQGVRSTISALSLDDAGKFLSHLGEEMPY